MNIYNFMDGINGLMGGYSIVVMASMYIVALAEDDIATEPILILALAALTAFCIFNFRNKAKAFSGDVGSIVLGFVIFNIAATDLYKLILLPLFTSVFLVDSGWTILRRAFKRQNILQSHRMHLYQHLANDLGLSHIKVSLIYSTLQLVINVAWMITFCNPFTYGIGIFAMLTIAYFVMISRK